MLRAPNICVPLNFELKYRPLCSLFYEAPEQVMRDCFVLFNFSDLGKWKRISFHSNYYNQEKPAARHYFVVESMPEETGLHAETLAGELDKDFKNTFLGTPWHKSLTACKLVGSHLTKNAYPIFDLDFQRQNVLDFKQKMKLKDIYLIGRQGEFDHNSSSDASLSGVAALREIIEKHSDETTHNPVIVYKTVVV